MAVCHSSGTARVLYRVLVLPNLRGGAYIPSAKGKGQLPYRSFSSTTPQHIYKGRREARPPETRLDKWNEEITAKLVWLVDPETNQLSSQPRTRFDLLRELNLDTHRLVQIHGQEYENLPICKIVSKKGEYEREKRFKQQAKEKKKLEAASKSLKTLELNWAMDQNDLGHKLDKVTEFLTEGRKVEVVLASKKRGRKANAEECEEVLRKIRMAVDAVQGAKESKEMQGAVGGFVTLFFQGRPVQQQSAQEAG